MGKFTLVGFDGVPQTILSHIGAAEISCIIAFRVTEIIEFALNRAEKGKNHISDAAQRSAGFSFTGLFGGAQKSVDSAAAAINHTAAQQDSNPDQTRVAAVSSAIIPLKLKFAMMIADFGLTKESAEYALGLKRVTCKRTTYTYKMFH